MMRRGSLALAAVTVALSVFAAPALAVQSSATPPTAVTQQADTLPRVVEVPSYGTVYVVPQQPKDTRTPRQRCVDEEVARAGGSPSKLTMGAIDLKCSQR
jgi:hypothetical protein